MKKSLVGIVPGILLMTLAAPGLADNREGAVTLSPFVGGYLLDHEQRYENRPMFGLRAGYNFTRHVTLEGMFGYSLTELKEKYGSREIDIYRYGGDILYHFAPENKFVPFIAVGGGNVNFHIPDTPSMKNHHSGLVNYGIGFKYFLTDNVALRGDARHVYLLNGSEHNNLEYSGGLTFQFGGKKNAAKAEAAAPAAGTYATDTTPPTVIFTSPVNGATAVYTNQKASVAFSEEIDPMSVGGGSFTLNQGQTPLSGKLTAAGSNVTFTPSESFEKGKTYTATVTPGIKDLAGNPLARAYVWTFKAEQGTDTTAPVVIFTSPVGGALSAEANQNLNVAFSENMDPATITPATFIVRQGNSPVSGKVSVSASTATFAPANSLVKGSTYTATVKNDARDLAGNPLASDYAWSFTAFKAPKVVGVLATLENSHFDFNSSAISENGKTILNHNAAALKANPAMKIRISGYTSAAGSEEYNQKLSERRATAVKDYLVKEAGIDGGRLTTIGHGESSPAQHEAVPSDRLSADALANMRVIIEVIE